MTSFTINTEKLPHFYRILEVCFSIGSKIQISFSHQIPRVGGVTSTDTTSTGIQKPNSLIISTHSEGFSAFLTFALSNDSFFFNTLKISETMYNFHSWVPTQLLLFALGQGMSIDSGIEQVRFILFPTELRLTIDCKSGFQYTHTFNTIDAPFLESRTAKSHLNNSFEVNTKTLQSSIFLSSERNDKLTWVFGKNSLSLTNASSDVDLNIILFSGFGSDDEIDNISQQDEDQETPINGPQNQVTQVITRNAEIPRSEFRSYSIDESKFPISITTDSSYLKSFCRFCSSLPAIGFREDPEDLHGQMVDISDNPPISCFFGDSTLPMLFSIELDESRTADCLITPYRDSIFTPGTIELGDEDILNQRDPSTENSSNISQKHPQNEISTILEKDYISGSDSDPDFEFLSSVSFGITGNRDLDPTKPKIDGYSALFSGIPDMRSKRTRPNDVLERSNS